MNFQRGLAPTEAIGIGQVAIAPIVHKLYNLDPNQMIRREGRKTFPLKRSIFDIESYLDNLVKPENGLNLRFIAFSTGEIDESGEEVIHRLSEYKGLYVKYGDKTYKIPK
jgi:hypothetical protein